MPEKTDPTSALAALRTPRLSARYEHGYAREPKQQRSRMSFERAVDAAVQLLVERRSDAFTLAEVADRAAVSTGSIYGRVDSKVALLRAAHSREMARITAEQERAFGEAPPEDEHLSETVVRVIRTLADLLHRNAPVLKPFMVLADHDSSVADLGKPGYDSMVAAFCNALLRCRHEISHPDAERAVAWSCTVVYSVLARWLGLGSAPLAAGEGDWESILTNLSEMVTAFLLLEPSPTASMPAVRA